MESREAIEALIKAVNELAETLKEFNGKHGKQLSSHVDVKNDSITLPHT